MEVNRKKLGIKIEVPELDDLPRHYVTMAVVSLFLLAGSLFFLIMEVLEKNIFI